MADEVISDGSRPCCVNRIGLLPPAGTAYSLNPPDCIMDKRDKEIADEVLLKVSKEIAVKFIEVGRLTPATFDTTFAKIYTTVKQTVNSSQ